MRREGEKGVALLTVLLLVAVMAAVAVGVLDDLRFSVRRTANARAIGQAQWYALGAEELARIQIVRRARLDPSRTTLEGDWNGRPITFPMEAGAIEASVSDATGCFNLNSVVEELGGGVYAPRPTGARQFVLLLSSLGFNEVQAGQLSGALIDWIDTDEAALAAEDRAYDGYRTAAAPLAEVSELRAVRGFTPQVYDRIRPFVCALPTTDLSPVNVNTLPPEKAVLIAVIMDGAVSEAAVRMLLQNRPESGWDTIEAFWNEPALVDHAPAGPARAQARLSTRFFALAARVAFAGAQVRLSSLFEADGAGVRLVARRWTRDE